MEQVNPSPVLQRTATTVDGLRLHGVRSSLSHEAMLFLHGVTRRWQSFLPILPSLCHLWQVHAFDFRGHGDSDRKPGGYCVVDYVREASSYVRQLGRPIVLYGHSLGALTAAGVAAEVPQLIRGVILEDPPFYTSKTRHRIVRLVGYYAEMQKLAGSTSPLGELTREVGKLAFEHPDTQQVMLLEEVRDSAALRFIASCLAKLDPEVLTPIVEGGWFKSFSWQEVLGQIRCPVLLLQGDPTMGGMLTHEDAELASAKIADCVHVYMKEGNHILHLSRTQEVLHAVMNFVETL